MAPQIAPGASQTARPSKCTILSDTRALGGLPTHTTAEARSAPHTFGPRTHPGNYSHSKCARNGTSNSGRNPSARHRQLAHQNAPSRGLHGPRVPCPRAHNRSSAPTHTCFDTHRRITGSLCTQKMLSTASQIARATLGRATPLAHRNAPSRALYTGPEWHAHAHNHEPQQRSTCVLPTRPKASWDSFVRKRCSQRQHVLDNARNSRGRASTDRSPIQMRVISCVTRALSGASAHTTAETPRARALNTQRARDASRDPFALKRCVLETCNTSKLLAERPATSRPSKSIAD